MVVTLKIAGSRYYAGVLPKPGSVLILDAEPSNPHDPNAIKILNLDEEQLGHVPAAAAALMTLVSQETGHPVYVLFEAKMRQGEEFSLGLKPPQSDED